MTERKLKRKHAYLCKFKQAFATVEEVKEHLNTVLKRPLNMLKGSRDIEGYKCLECSLYHIGHHPNYDPLSVPVRVSLSRGTNTLQIHPIRERHI